MGSRRIALLLTTVLCAHPAYAQDAADDRKAPSANIPEIIVTADKFAKSIQDTPIAVSVVQGDRIAENGSTKIDDVLKNEAAVTVQGAARGFIVSIRGLGLSLPPQMGQGAVSTNYDGAYSSRAENGSVGFYDLARVEVLRGPQSTLYGRNSVGGVVNVISKDPQIDVTEGYLSGEVGNYSLFHGEGAINVPLGKTLALRVAGAGITRDGYMSNGHDDNKSYAGRAKLLWEPGDAVRVMLGVEHTALRGQGPGAVPIANILAGNRDTTDVSVGFQRINYWKYWADISADIGPGTLRLIPSYQRTSGVSLGAFGGSLGYAFDPKLTRQEQVEVRYSSQAGSPVEWNLGFYHYKNHNVQQTISGACQDTEGNYVIPAPGYNSVPDGLPPGPAPAGGCIAADLAPAESYEAEIRNSQTDGIFGQVTIPLGSRLRAIAGLRYTWEKITGANDDSTDYTGPIATIKDKHFDYRLGLEADIASTTKAYATVASGYRQGGYGFGLVPFEPEKMTSYEVGLKNRFAGGNMQLNLTGFYYDYKSFQLTIANFAVSPAQLYVPTMPAREYGVEAETQIAVGSRGRFNGSVTWLDSRLDGIDGFYVGLPFPNSPTWSVKLGYEQGFDLGGVVLTPRGDLRFASSSIVYPEDHAINDRDPSAQNDWVSGDISIRAEFGGAFSLVAYVKNVNDAMIKQSHFFGYAQLAAPRTYGMTATYRF